MGASQPHPTLALVAVLAATAVAAPPAQTGAPREATTQGPQQQPRQILFDRVITVIGDKAILESAVQAELRPKITGTTHKVPREQQAQWRNQIIERLIEEEAMAQSAFTMKGSTRKQVERMFDQLMHDYQQREIEKAGSVNELTRNLGVLGKTWDTMFEEKRTETLAQITEHRNLTAKFQDRRSLLVTPREMRRFYDENRSLFVEQGSTDVAVVAFPVGKDPAAARTLAAKAAAAWRDSEKTGAEIAEAFGGFELKSHRGVRDTEDDPNAPAIRAFAARAAQDDVSDPIRSGGVFWVLRAEKVNAGRDDHFEDPGVQRRIQLFLIGREIGRMRDKLRYESLRRFDANPNRPR